MLRTLKTIWHGLTAKGALFPHQLAFTLLIPLRNWALSPAELVRRLELQPQQRILEVGCGPGYFSPVLARAVPQGSLVLADIQPEMLAKARQRLEKRHITNAKYHLCSGSSFPFASGSFHRIVLVTVLGEVADQAAYLAEFHRLLAPDGLLSISEAAGDADKLSRAELIQLLEQYGFTPVQQFGNERNYTLNFSKTDLSLAETH